MKRETIKFFFKYMHMCALAALVAVVTPATAQTLLEENFSSGFEEWTVVHPPGAFNGSTRWQVGTLRERRCLKTAMSGRPTRPEC